jgi:hypothetical protein
MDDIEICGDFDPELSMLLDEAIQQEEYHREKLVEWRKIRENLQLLIPDPINEVFRIAEAAWSQKK